jgi:hypothetical protein
VISLNLVLAGLRLGLKNRQVGEKWVSEALWHLKKPNYPKYWIIYTCFVKFRENACVLLKAGFEWGAFFWFS